MQTPMNEDEATVVEGEEPTAPPEEGAPAMDEKAAPEELTPPQKVMIASMRIMWRDPKITQGIVRMLKGQNGLATAALFVLRILFNESKERIPPQLLLLAVEPIVGELAEMAEAVGVKIDPNTIPQVVQQVRSTIQQKLAQGKTAPQGVPPGAQAAPGAQPPAQRPGGGLIQQAMGG